MEKLGGKRRLGGASCRCVDTIKMDLKGEALIGLTWPKIWSVVNTAGIFGFDKMASYDP
jgi:hypothetical protein